jgi:hypothetical protein
MPNRYDVFISHSTADRAWATDFATRLQDRGLRVFYDVWSTAPGASIEDTIREGLRDSSHVVVMFDQSSVSSAWSAFELGAAIGMGKHVVSVVATNVPVDRLPGPAQQLQTVSVDSPDDAAEKVAKLIQRANVTKP